MYGLRGIWMRLARAGLSWEHAREWRQEGPQARADRVQAVRSMRWPPGQRGRWSLAPR